MNADILTTRAADGIAVITLGSAKRIYFDAEMGDMLTEALDGFAGDPNIRVVVVTGGARGYFNRHFSIPALIEIAESLRASGRQWPENATYNGGFFDKAMALCESMPKPVIAAISGTALAGAFEFALACDLRIAEDGEYLIGLPEEGLGARNRQRQSPRSRHGDRTAPVVAYAGIACLHQASRPQRHRYAAGAGIGARTKPFFEIVYL